MSRDSARADRYQSLRRTGLVLARLAPLVTFAFWALGLGLFLDQSRDLISDAQFTWGERQVMAVIAAATVGSCLVAGWVVGRLIRAASDLIDVVADLGESSWRTGDLIERHVIPLLGRIATNLEQDSLKRDVTMPSKVVREDSPQSGQRPESSKGTSPGR